MQSDQHRMVGTMEICVLFVLMDPDEFHFWRILWKILILSRRAYAISSWRFHKSSPIISSMSCIWCLPIWIVYDAVSIFSPAAPFQNPAWNRLNTYWAIDSRTIPIGYDPWTNKFTWYLFTANDLMFSSVQLILFRIIVSSLSTFYRVRNKQRHQETNRLSNTHCRNEINVERDSNKTQANVDSIHNKRCY